MGELVRQAYEAAFLEPFESARERRRIDLPEYECPKHGKDCFIDGGRTADADRTCRYLHEYNKLIESIGAAQKDTYGTPRGEVIPKKAVSVTDVGENVESESSGEPVGGDLETNTHRKRKGVWRAKPERDPAEEGARGSGREALFRGAFSFLPDIEQKVLRARFGIGRDEQADHRTLEIADELALMPQEIAAVETRAIVRLKELLHDICEDLGLENPPH